MPHEETYPQALVRCLRAVIALSAADREAWLLQHCDDPSLREEVLALCRTEQSQTGLLDHQIDELGGKLIEPAEELAAAMLGARIGAWEVTELLGEGGMATVWLGRRCEGDFEQEVAIKCLKTAVAGPAYQRLFRREQQILASLESPGIARLLDGGVTSEGVPYIVMERVSGQPLHEAVAARGLDLRQTLHLFIEICEVVQYAHQKLVVHRDLKPGNILIDEQGRPRLLDFGVAGLIDQASANASATRSVALTPAYAAPEQLEGKTVGVGADVYALGLILCELLTGGEKPPRDSDEDPISRRRAWPSRMLQTGQGHGSARIRSRAARLRGDLDAIVLKCLRRDPAQRYASVAELAQDLRAHLAQRPVQARRGNFGYRANLFLRRNAIALGAAAVVLVALLAALAWSLRENRQTRMALDESVAARTFLVELFESNLPGAAASAPLTAEVLLERGAERARTDLEQKPALQVLMLTTIGQVYRRLDHHDQARALLQEAMAVARTQAAAGSPVDNLDTRFQLGMLAHQEGQYEQAAKTLEVLLAEQRRQGATPKALAETMRVLGWSRSQLGQHEEAIALQREALAVAQAMEVIDAELLVGARNDLGAALFKAGKHEQAIVTLRRALEDHERVFGRVHAQTNTAMGNLAAVLDASGHQAEALALMRDVVERDSQIYKGPNRHLVIHLRTLGSALLRAGELQESRDVLARGRDMALAVHGRQHPNTARSTSMLGYLEYRLGHLAEAERLQRLALAGFQAVGDGRSYIVAAEQTNMARTLARAGKLAEARSLAEAALRLKSELRGADHRSLAVTLASLARIERQSGNLEAAARLLQRALTLEGESRRNSKNALAYRRDLAYVDCLREPGDEPLAAFDVILAHPEVSAQERPLARAAILSMHGDCLHHMGREQQARTSWQQVLQLRQNRLPADFPDSLRLRKQLQ